MTFIQAYFLFRIICARIRAMLESNPASTRKPGGLEAPGGGGRKPSSPTPDPGTYSTPGRCSKNSPRSVNKET